MRLFYPGGPKAKAWSLFSAIALAAAVPVAGLLAPAAIAAEVATLDRPVFDRAENAILIPYQGPAPRYSTETKDDGMILEAVFQSSHARIPTTYRLGLFHPVVSKVEMASLGQGRVRVTVHALKPSSLRVEPDPRRGVLRLRVVDAMMADGPNPGPVKPAPGLEPLTPAPPSIRPQPRPSIPPTAYKGTVSGMPSSGEYVYRKAIPTGRGDVTEVEVRSPKQASIQVNQDPRSEAVVVNVLREGEVAPVPHYRDYAKLPLPNEPWKMPDRSSEARYRPVAAVDTLVGMTLMSEKAPTFGSDFAGLGATLWGFNAHVPLGSAINVSLGGQAFAFDVSSKQVALAETRRNEYDFSGVAEYLVVRRPWVLAVGPGYWVRYVQTNTTKVLAPPEPSLLFVPTMLHHGPVAHARAYYPIWDALSVEGELGLAPYLLNGGDVVSTSLTGLFGTQEYVGLKWGTRHLAVTAGFRHQGVFSYSPGYMVNRGGPEVSLVWRF